MMRHIYSRIAEHGGVSTRTGRRFPFPRHSNIRQHFSNSDHPINTSNLKCIGFTNRIDLRTINSIYIHRLKPSLNNHDSSVILNILN